MTRRTAGLALLTLLLGISGCVASANATPARVLFLGNSLTDGNDVPGIVLALAELQGFALQVGSETPGGYSLEDHWNTGHSQLVPDGDYDLVVLQQGPSTLPESQKNLKEWTRVWTDYAHSQGTEAALFMVWPYTWQLDGFALVSQSYRNAAVASGIEVFPAGEAWDAALQSRRGLQLYRDDLHANSAGSLLAAMVIGRRLFALDPARVPTRLATRSGVIVVNAADLELFRAVVAAIAPATLELSPPIAPPPTTVILPTPTGNPGGGGGGGGSTSWGATLLLALAAIVCHLRPRGR